MDPYQVLGVRPDAGRPEIRRAYLALARRHHPDQVLGQSERVRSESEGRMREVNEAWAILGDADRRSRYDQGATPEEPSVVRPPAAGAAWRPRKDDTAWMDDFGAWRDGREDFLGPDDYDGPARPVRMVLPVVSLGIGILLACVALTVNSGWIFALAGIVLLCSMISFFMVPLVLMTRRNSR